MQNLFQFTPLPIAIKLSERHESWPGPQCTMLLSENSMQILNMDANLQSGARVYMLLNKYKTDDDYLGSTLVSKVLQNNQSGILHIQELLADPNYLVNGASALWHAVCEREIKPAPTALHGVHIIQTCYIVSTLLRRKADANIGNQRLGISPLMQTIRSGIANIMEGQTGILMDLCDNGACVNEQDTEGWTPLHYSAYDGLLDVVNILIQNGADLSAVTKVYAQPHENIE